MRKLTVALLFVSLGLLAACGGGGGGGGSTSRNISGTYTAALSGTIAGVPFSDTATFTISQSGSTISGTWIVPGTADGSISGVVAGNDLTFSLSQINPCAGTFSGRATITSDKAFAGNYAGTECRGSVSASFSATRP